LTNVDYQLDYISQGVTLRILYTGRIIDMPTYEYRCRDCEKNFSVIMRIEEHDKGGTTCPECKGTSVVQQYTAFFAKTRKKS
jgi:putative FmdB family regulatory protein